MFELDKWIISRFDRLRILQNQVEMPLVNIDEVHSHMFWFQVMICHSGLDDEINFGDDALGLGFLHELSVVLCFVLLVRWFG